ncbi:MAG: putative glycoside hydrolase [Patescibacteria group bacterium]
MILPLINLLVILPLMFFSLLITGNQPTFEVLNRPQKIENKGIYLTAYTAGMKQRRQELVNLIKTTELNSIVIDVKDYSGKIFFDANLPLADKIKSKEIRIPDLDQWVAELKKQGIYTIARIVVFQDPYLAEKRPDIALKSKAGGTWRDRKGLSWVDPTQRLVWDYNMDLAKEAVRLGFDEVNFDYIRFPSDGDIKQIVYANLDNNSFEAKSRAMAKFYNYVNQSLTFYPIITSADLFGMVLWRKDGLNIGQTLEDAALNFDYVCPMVYPSHYPPNFQGFANPADHPYEVVYQSLIRAKDDLKPAKAKMRPWLQDFDMGAEYTPQMIRAQIQASYDSNSVGWLLWNASNRYTAAALESK